MLSNKLTFSLTSLVVLMVAFCLPVTAQTTETLPVPDVTIPANGFVVLTDAAANDDETLAGIDDGNSGNTGDDDVLNRQLAVQNLSAFFAAGGTIELVITAVTTGADASQTDLSTTMSGKQVPGDKDLVISEIMWASDVTGVDNTTGLLTRSDAKQWIEIYNSTNYSIAIADTAGTAAVKAELVFTAYTIPTDTEGTIADTVSNLHRGKWTMPGQDGVSVFGGNAVNFPAQKNLVSAYRKINYPKVKGIHKVDLNNVVIPDANRTEQKKGIPDGRFLANWAATPVAGSRNMAAWHIGTPGLEHVPGTEFTFDIPVTTIPHAGNKVHVVINEVRNDTSAANVDWVELYNTSKTTAVDLYNWELTLIQDAYKEDDIHKNDYVLVGRDEEYSPADQLKHSFPKGFMLEPEAYLLIVNQHPRDTPLANGVNIDDVLAGKEIKAGATHEYIVRTKLNLPDDTITLILRDAVDKNARHKEIRKDDHATARRTDDVTSSKNIVDNAGALSIPVDTSEYNTQFWPFRGWEATTDNTGKKANGDRFPKGTGVAWERTSYAANRGHHEGSWVKNGVGHKGGIGYDPGVDLRIAPGTPGYANSALKSRLVDDKNTASTTDDVPFDGMISISEVMVDAGPRWNLIQWIELYNSSMTEVINLKGWELEIRNATDEVESYVDSGFMFNDAYILPNQTLLLVSGTGTNDVADNRVYNLYQNHRRDLGLSNRRSVLLSPTGFYLKLSNKDDGMVDEAGNVKVEGATRTVMWDLPDRGDIRQSLVRQYGGMYRTTADGVGPEPAEDGTMMESWEQSDLAGAGISFYGHRDDAGTPGFRVGGPLPVSLSKFRPVRNQETGHVDITWITESELNNAGFNILRSEAKNGEFKVINVKGIVAGHGTTSEKHVYTFTDTTAKPNVVYYYQIEDVSINGLRTTLTTTHLRGHVGAAGKLTTRWSELKSSGK